MITPTDLSAIEMAIGMTLGDEPGRQIGSSGRELHAVMASWARQHLERPPCIVWFSGDAGSTMLLGIAVTAARDHGLPAPVPVSPTHGGSRPDAHQEAVIAALRLHDWERPDVTGTTGLVGAIARSGLRRHGIQFPPLAHLFVTLFQIAGPGGTVISNHAAHELWPLWRGAALVAACRRRRLTRRDLRSLGAIAPIALRRAAARKVAGGLAVPYLQPEVSRVATAALVEEFVRCPLTAAGAARALGRKRCGPVADRAYHALAADHGVHFGWAGADLSCLEAFAGDAGVFGWESPSAMTAAVAPYLPRRTLPEPNPDYAHVWSDEGVQEFVDDWNGDGIDSDVVDPEQLKDAWRRRDWRAGMLLQSAWLFADRRDSARHSERVAPAG